MAGNRPEMDEEKTGINMEGMKIRGESRSSRILSVAKTAHLSAFQALLKG